MPPPPPQVWRVFPWDPTAFDGEPFSPSYLPVGQGGGRFDMPDDPYGVLYTAESPEHAVAERIQHLRGQMLEEHDLIGVGRPLALAAVTLPEALRAGVADLCDPDVLGRLGIRPDEIASRHRPITQRIATIVHEAGHTGLRWWSAFFGEWHTVVFFRRQLSVALTWTTPEPLSRQSSSVRDAARLIGIGLPRPPRRRGRPPGSRLIA